MMTSSERPLHAVGGLRQQDLADQFGVRQSAISRIIHRKRWLSTDDDVP
jgi:plasmid maintenance system antidote protein VapI